MDLDNSKNGELFLAVVPDASATAKMNRLAGILKQAHQFNREPVLDSRLHVTLVYLGAWSPEMVRLTQEVAVSVRMPAFEASFNRTASFSGKPGHQPFVLFGDDGPNPLKTLRQSLGDAMARKGLRHPARRDFTPHVTLFYGEREVDEYPVEPPIGWAVNEFALIYSLRGHTCLGRWRFDV